MHSEEKSTTLDVFLKGDAGRLHAKYQSSIDHQQAPSVLILHPDTRCGGSANSHMVKLLGDIFVSIGFTVMRLNFRGAGRSDGQFDGSEEIRDAAVALDWLQQHNPESSHFWIAGFSFGTWIGANLMMRRPEVESFIFLSPFVDNNYDFTFLSPCPASGLMIYGKEDKIIKESNVDDVVQFLNNQNEHIVECIKIENASHTFSGHDEELRSNISSYINMMLAMRVPKPVRKKRRRRKKRDSII